MGRVAFVFSGQGDQHSGMGAALCARYPSAKEIFERCDVLRHGTSEMCFFGSDADLKETRNTQPCLFAVELAAAAALESCGLKPDMAAGFSLGELSALTYAGVMTLEEGFSLVCKRGELMQQDAQKYATSMAAVLKLSAGQVEELCAAHEGVYPVNYNCPGQVACSGLEAAMPAFIAAIKEAGGRVMPLKVRGGFHSPFMRDAAQAFEKVLAEAELNVPKMPVYSDVTGGRYPDEVVPLLAKQIASPVRWECVVRSMIDAGATTFVEIGPGKTLCNLIGRIDVNVCTFAVKDYEEFEALCAEVGRC